jgi:hypothetical protein
MLNIGVMFILFGAMLLAMDIFYKISTRKWITTTATIIGYKQFPADKIITHNDIARDGGNHFAWIRVVEFINPETNEKLRMLSNPRAPFPEQIGTMIKINFNPNKIDLIKDCVFVHDGFAYNRDIGKASIFSGLVLYFVLFFVTSPFIYFMCTLGAFSIIFIRGTLLRHRKR